MPPQDKPSPGRFHALLDRSAAAWLILAIGLVVTLGLWQYFGTHFAERARDRFSHRAEAAKNLLLSRMQAHEKILRGAAALFAASDHVSRAEWRAYIAALELDRSLPGIQGTGFTRMISADQLAAHVAGVRAEGFPDYVINPPGERDAYSSILYLEPFTDRNLRAFGYDMYSEPVRREAMQRARDSGAPALSGKVTLVQESGPEVQAGFLIYLPIYARGTEPETVNARREALLGFVYSPFRAHDIMDSIFSDRLNDVALELFDGAPTADSLLFASAQHSALARFVVDHPVDIAGRTWLARFSSTPAFDADNDSAEPGLILFGGTTMSLMLFALLNINARHRRRMQTAAARLAQSRDEFRTLVENVPGVVFRCQVAAPWSVIHISPNIRALTGAAPEEFVSAHVSFGDFIVPEDFTTIEDAIATALRERTSYEVEYRMQSRTGQTYWVSERGHVYVDSNGQPQWLDGVIIDITERKKAEEAIRNLAFVDTLTNLPNRRFLLERLRQGLANSRRHGNHGALLFIDLDHFKSINDTYGHEAGDRLLCEVARRLRQSVRKGDTVGRLGGDEFVVMLEDLSDSAEAAREKGAAIGDKILAALNEPFEIDGDLHQNTPSIGMTCFGSTDEHAEELLRRADAAMYRAKAAGRNRLETNSAQPV
ncbi:CHASE domain-containing protein [Thauera sp.]|jgi:diguanylate cyclase (GGDEF)-like protein/PAS domain S-box-containing protein|uniref:CHASE domain-containing protein n=1 Tax=Thauera sp. TaxID=1905334 RepID=UPI002A36B699|nr:CHASE domain-containing protein [Thauera sp.]MDX9884500.1 CHASE domain-containing protein [Thauera sp.]